MELITSRQGMPHVTVTQASAVNAAAAGVDTGVFGGFEAVKADNVTVMINKMSGVVQGRQFCVLPTDPDTVTINAGVSGKNRITLICLAVSQNISAGTQSAYWVTVDGTAATTATIPTVPNQGSLDNGDALVYFPILRVDLTGTTISNISLYANMIHGMRLLASISERGYSNGDTITVNGIKNYKMILVYHTSDASNASGYMNTCGCTMAYRPSIGAASKRFSMEEVQYGNNGLQMLTAFRGFTFDDNGLTLENCYLNKVGSSASMAAVTNACMPVAVYGVM